MSSLYYRESVGATFRAHFHKRVVTDKMGGNDLLSLEHKKESEALFPMKICSFSRSLSLSRGTDWNVFQGRLERRQHPFNCGRVSISPSAATRHSVATTVAVNRFSERPVVFECCQTSGRTSSSKPFVLNPKTRNRLLGN